MTAGAQPGEQHRLFRDIVRALSLTLDFDDGHKLFHAWRVALLSEKLGAALGVEDRGNLFYAGLLHDLGGIGLPDSTVHGFTTGAISQEARNHSLEGARILRPLTLFAPIEPLIADHHERTDGRGFPRGRRGDEVGLGASIVSAADLMELTMRAQEPAKRLGSVRALLGRERGKGWPTSVSEAALAVLDGHPGLIEELHDDAWLTQAVRAVDFAPQGLEHLNVVELLSQLLWVFARVIDEKHPFTLGHSMRVTQLAHRITQVIGGDELNDWDVVWAGLLHDVGKVGVPRAVLGKTSNLDRAEWALIRKHATDSRTIISSIEDLAYLARPAASHHEAWDGSGYPEGLEGEEIPLLGRVLAFADTYDAMRSLRPHREPYGHAQAMEVIRRGRGRNFDPHLADFAEEALESIGRQAWPPSTGLENLQELLHTDTADLRSILGAGKRGGAVGKSGDRGTLLPEAEPWTVLELSAELEVLRGEAALSVLSGCAGTSLLAHLDSDAEQRLRAWIAGPVDEPLFAAFVLTPEGRPLEVVLERSGGSFRLLCRSAESRLQSVKRLALFYRNFLSSVEAAFFTDPDGAIVDVNGTFLELYGYRLHEVVGKPPPILRATALQGASFTDLMEKASLAGAWHGEIPSFTSQGREVAVLFTLSAVRDSSARPLGYIARAVDITERKRLESELAQKNQTLESLSRFKSDLIAITSHDLKSPVAGMMSYAKLMQSHLEEQRADKALPLAGRIVKLGEDMLGLIDDLLSLEKLDSGTLRLEVAAVRLDAELRSIVDTHVLVARERGLELTFSVRTRPRLIFADRHRLGQVFSNLISNALKFSSPGTRIEVEYEDDGEKARVLVSDRGRGIPPDELERIFERYHQVPGSTRASGVGLGLAIARNIVALHQGRIWAQNRPEGGCRFVVELPAQGVKAGAKGLAVLVVGPLPWLGTQLEALARSSGARVVRAGELLEARRVLYADRPALIFVDQRELAGELEGWLAELRRGERAPLIVEVRGQGAAETEALDRTLVAPVLDIELLELLREASVTPSPGARP